jgi:very-short-patch-repair endonuclease
MLERAKNFRQSMTEAENRIWYYLRDRRLNGYKFVRESVIGFYIVDFVCRRKKIILELDGSQHAEVEAIKYDKRRTEFLEKKGYKILRVWNGDVFDNIDGVLEFILEELEGVQSSRPSSPALLPSQKAR